MKEIFKDIPSYEGYYQVSNLGRVKSLERVVYKSDGRPYTFKERILKEGIDGREYLKVILSKGGKPKTLRIHQLVAISFLGHKPCGMKKVVNHIDNDKTNNRLDNLEIVTQRENAFTHYIGTSKYKGVSWCKSRNKWKAQISLNGKVNYLGSFEKEIDAHKAYQKRLREIAKLETIN
jgi:hypothetical protein